MLSLRSTREKFDVKFTVLNQSLKILLAKSGFARFCCNGGWSEPQLYVIVSGTRASNCHD